MADTLLDSGMWVIINTVGRILGHTTREVNQELEEKGK
jgi:hypothetical protein